MSKIGFITHHKQSLYIRGIDYFVNLLKDEALEIHLIQNNNNSNLYNVDKVISVKQNIISKIFLFDFLINPFWIIFILFQAFKNNWSSLICFEIRLSLNALIVSKILNIPIFLICRENQCFSDNPNFLSRLIIIYLSKMYYFYFLKYFDHIFTVSLTLKNYFKVNCNLEKNITVIRNFPSKNFLNIIKSEKNKIKKIKKNKVNFIISGYIQNEIKKELIKIFNDQKIKKKMTLYIISEKSIFQKDHNKDIIVKNFLSIRSYIRLLLKCDVGIEYRFFKKENNGYYTIPGRLFEYLFSDLIVLCPFRNEYKYINKKLGSKFYLEFKNRKELKKIIINLISNIERYIKINKKNLTIKKMLNLQKIQDGKFSHILNKTFKKYEI